MKMEYWNERGKIMKKNHQNKLLCLAWLIILCSSGCYIDIYDFYNVPEYATAWIPLKLNAYAAVSSNYLWNFDPDVRWSIKNAGTTQAKIKDGYLIAMAPGTVVVSLNAGASSGAMVKDELTKLYSITVYPASEEIQILGTELISHNVNTADNPIQLKVNIKLEVQWEALLNMLIIADRYVNLDFTGSTGTLIPGLSGSSKLKDEKVLSIVLPESITRIGSYAFSCYNGITSVSMGNNISDIGHHAFNNCYNLTEIIIPDSVTSIEHSAFANCYGLTSVIISNNITGISKDIFYNCYSLTGVIIPDGVIDIGDKAFYNCFTLTGIIIPDSVTSMGKSVFYGCSNLKAIDVSNGNTMFSTIDGILYDKTATSLIYCPTGKTGIINIPDTVTRIEDSAFNGCGSLTGVIIPDSVISIGDSAFKDCGSLTSVIIPDSVISIEAFTFNGCGNLTGVNISDNVTGIGKSAFSNCSSLTNVIIPDSVTNIDNYAFFNCSSLINVIIPDNVTNIGEYAFDDCNSLTGVVIGNKVETIKKNAFNCSKLVMVTLNGTITQNGFDDKAFTGDLRLVYFANSGGKGTYTRKSDSTRWNKQ